MPRHLYAGPPAQAPDRFIIGDGVRDGHEYVIHTQRPRFICRLVFVEDEDDNRGVLSNLSRDTRTGHRLFDFLWLDDIPEEAALFEILDHVSAALELAGDLAEAADPETAPEGE